MCNFSAYLYKNKKNCDIFDQETKRGDIIYSSTGVYKHSDIYAMVVVLQVRLAIAEKGLHCKEYDVSLPLSEHNEPWFMHLNPTGEVPVLLHNDSVICDPTQIMDYLEQNFNDGETE